MASGMDVVGGRSTAVCGGKVEPSTNNVETVIDLTADKTEESRELPGVHQTPNGEHQNVRFEDQGYHTGFQHKTALPLTPSPTPKLGHKRNIYDSSDSDLIELTDKPTKRTLFGTKGYVSTAKPSRSFPNVPSFSVLATPRRAGLSASEMRRMSEAIIEQVDWDEVADYVASNRGAQIYKTAFKGTMQAKVDELEGRAGGDDVLA